MQQASVLSIDALKDFRAALIEFGEDAKLALGEAQSDVQRTIWWVQHDQPAHWQRELRHRNNRLNEAKTDLARVQLQQASTVAEKKKVVACQRAVEEAEEKLRRIKQWSLTLDKELMLFRGQCNSLAGVLDGELPNVIARMERMIDTLHQYVALKAPTFDPIAPVSDAGGPAPPSADASGSAANPEAKS
jgi:hypothetical protein